MGLGEGQAREMVASQATDTEERIALRESRKQAREEIVRLKAELGEAEK
jgi:hypothetical protein